MKYLMFVIGLVLNFTAYSQKTQFAFGMGIDGGFSFPEDNQFTLIKASQFDTLASGNYLIDFPQQRKNGIILTLNALAKYQLKAGWNVIAYVDIGIQKHLFAVNNLKGDYIPEGLTVQKTSNPNPNVNNKVYVGNQYEYFVSLADVSQHAFSILASYNVEPDIEFAFGVSYRLKTTRILNQYAQDYYSLVKTQGGTNHYAYSNTKFSKSKTITQGLFGIPLSLAYTKTLSNNNFLTFVGTTIISTDTYFNIKALWGFNALSNHPTTKGNRNKSGYDKPVYY